MCVIYMCLTLLRRSHKISGPGIPFQGECKEEDRERKREREREREMKEGKEKDIGIVY